MNKIALVFTFIVILLNIYLGSLQYKLNLMDVYKTDKRFSIKRLNKALIEAKDEEQRKLVIYAKKIYIINSVVFYILIILIIAALCNGC